VTDPARPRDGGLNETDRGGASPARAGERGRATAGLGGGMAVAATPEPVGVGAPPPLDPGLSGRSDRPVPGIDNGYVAGYRIRFDEAGADGLVRTGSLLRYAQDIAWRHSEDRGFDRRWYADEGRWWVVRSIALTVLAPVAMGRTLRLATAVVGHRRIWARRHGEFGLADGSPAAIADVDWVILDERGRILRIPPEFGDAFPNPEIGGEIIRADPPAAPSEALRHPVRARPQDLDPMAHVNNAVYMDWAEEALIAAGAGDAVAALPRTWRAEYAASTELGDELTAIAWSDGTGWWVILERRSDGAVAFRARLEAGTPG